jgi:hypothetical protein
MEGNDLSRPAQAEYYVKFCVDGDALNDISVDQMRINIKWTGEGKYEPAEGWEGWVLEGGRAGDK